MKRNEVLSTTVTSHRLMPGSVFNGRYTIHRVLGQGAMGIVYEATDQRSGQACALKLMNRDLAADASFVARFQSEALVGERIQSPHIARVFDSGWSQAPKSQPYFAMELLTGINLEQRLAQQPVLPTAEAVHLVKELFRALAKAHEAAVVHRDLKPENLFLCQATSPGQRTELKVLDFGVAKVVRETTHGGTAPGLGTPLWTAPEQGKEGQIIKPAADVWALGLLTFRLLCGKVYWRGASAKGATAFDLAVEMLREPLAPASVRSRELGAKQLGPAFDSWFAQAVNREASQRFADAGQAEAALLPILASLPTSAQEASPIASPWRRRWLPLLLLAGLLLILGLFGLSRLID